MGCPPASPPLNMSSQHIASHKIRRPFAHAMQRCDLHSQLRRAGRRMGVEGEEAGDEVDGYDMRCQ
eukprot:6315726-Pyramimonas_sp.AAC.1